MKKQCLHTCIRKSTTTRKNWATCVGYFQKQQAKAAFVYFRSTIKLHLPTKPQPPNLFKARETENKWQLSEQNLSDDGAI